MMNTNLIILLFFFLNALIDARSQELVEAMCYGGKQQLKEFINAEMVYPEKALQDQTEGIVVIHFAVDESGKVTEKSVANSVSPEIDREALRLFSKLLWHPATYYKTPVSVKQSLPLEFNIKKYNRIVKRRGYSALNYPVANYDTTNRIYDYGKVDELPQPVFEEDDMNLGKFIAQNTKYPEIAYKQNISGTVKVQFVVEPSGNISNSIIVEHLGAGCCEEAQRVMGLIKWKPGIKNDKAVRTMLVLGITFGGGVNSSFEYFPASHGSTMQ